jgi:hypothetical protein
MSETRRQVPSRRCDVELNQQRARTPVFRSADARSRGADSHRGPFYQLNRPTRGTTNYEGGATSYQGMIKKDIDESDRPINCCSSRRTRLS